ncbi:MAG: hypothetical protein WCH65_08880 [bacterium]
MSPLTGVFPVITGLVVSIVKVIPVVLPARSMIVSLYIPQVITVVLLGNDQFQYKFPLSPLNIATVQFASKYCIVTPVL